MALLNKMNKNIFVFKISFKQQFLMVIPLIVVNIAIVIGLLYTNTTGNLLLGMLIAVFIISVLPVIIVHTQYYIANRGANLNVDIEKGILNFTSPKQYYEYSFDDIKYLDHHVSYGGGSGWYTFGEYGYYKITFKDNREINITCLMMNDIQNKLEKLLGRKAEKFPAIIPFIKK